MISRNLARKIANDEDVDVKFSHNVQMLTDFVDTTILVVIAGRGMSKRGCTRGCIISVERNRRPPGRRNAP